MKWTVVIPTLWKPATFPTLIHQLSACTYVAEILIIDNNKEACSEKAISLPKVRHLPQVENIFVNPAWNLGVQLAKHDYICLCNDDVLFDCPTVFGHFEANELRGIVGIDSASYDAKTWNDDEPRSNRNVYIKEMWASMLFFKRQAYRPIPDELKIWWGDAWLAWYCKPASAILTRIETKHSESVASPQFRKQLRADTYLWNSQLKPFRLKLKEKLHQYLRRLRK